MSHTPYEEGVIIPLPRWGKMGVSEITTRPSLPLLPIHESRVFSPCPPSLRRRSSSPHCPHAGNKV